MSRHFDSWYYPPSTPRAVEGGIRARNKRGAFAGRWWGKRWLQTLESFRIGARLTRGRSYARSGQVAKLNIGKGTLSASVQGSRRTPYKVTLGLKAFTAGQWQTLIERLREKPLLAAQLLGNEMPEELEAVFSEAGLPLFPQRHDDLATDCSCPDWSNPCKHIAAVYYLLAEAFDSDPFLLFKLRGMERDAFLDALREAGAEENPEDDVPAPEPVALPGEGKAFWEAPLPGEKNEPPQRPRLHAALPKRLGPLPFWRAPYALAAVMEKVYAAASQSGLERFLALEEGDSSMAQEPGSDTVPEASAVSGSSNPPEEAASADPDRETPNRILAAMEPGREYRRADLTAALGIAEKDWTRAIRLLKDQGQVIQSGQRRGARYRKA